MDQIRAHLYCEEPSMEDSRVVKPFTDVKVAKNISMTDQQIRKATNVNTCLILTMITSFICMESLGMRAINTL